ncbi:MAG: cation transporting ATPase C-terminal domain-containing protein [Myxococcales bacterium]
MSRWDAWGPRRRCARPRPWRSPPWSSSRSSTCWSCRSLKGSALRLGLFSNPAIYLGIGVVLALQMALLYLPLLNRVFATAPLAPFDLGRSALAGAVVLPIVALEKRIRNRWEKRRRARAPRRAPLFGEPARRTT